MGAALMKYFNEAKSVGGLKAQMRLAMKSGLASAKAETAADSPELVSKMKAAWDEVKKEF